MTFTLGTTEQDLMAQRANTLSAIQARGGKTAASNYSDRLAQIDAALKQMRSAAPQPAATPAPQPVAPATPAPQPAAPVSLPPGQTAPGAFDPGTAINTNPVQNSSPDDIAKAAGNIKNTQTGQVAENAAAEGEARRNLQLSNPNQINPFGTQQYTTDENGNVIQTQKLSDSQQTILNQGEGITKAGQAIAQSRLGGFSGDFNPQTAARTTTGDLAADRARIEDALYQKMTKNVDSDQARQVKEKEQQLFNRGIAFSADPQSRYQQEMRAINDNFNSIRDSARLSSIQAGGEEYQRDFGINEQLIANQYSQQLGTRNQNLGEIGAVQGMGTGLQMPNFNAYQGPNYNPANPMDVYSMFRTLSQNDKTLAIQRAAAAMRGGGGGGAAQPADPDAGVFEGL